MFEVLGVDVYPLSILFAMLANIVLGMLWYSPILFGNLWMKRLGFKKESLEMTPIDFVLSIGVAFLAATGLNSVIQFSAQVSDLSEIVNIFATAFMVTFTLSLPIALNGVIYEKRDKIVFVINIFYHLINFIIMGFVISIWI